VAAWLLQKISETRTKVVMSFSVKQGLVETLKRKLWIKRYLSLHSMSIIVAKSRGDMVNFDEISLKQIASVSRTDLRDFCFEVKMKNDGKTLYFNCNDEKDVYDWVEEIYRVF
jgi:predicted lipid carrier protein YhbT